MEVSNGGTSNPQGSVGQGWRATESVKLAYPSKILTEMPQVLEKVSMELGQQKKQLQLSVNSRVDNPVATLESFNRQFQLKEQERQAVIFFF